MKDDNEIVIRISPQEGRICVEENDNGVISRKGISADNTGGRPGRKRRRAGKSHHTDIQP